MRSVIGSSRARIAVNTFRSSSIHSWFFRFQKSLSTYARRQLLNKRLLRSSAQKRYRGMRSCPSFTRLRTSFQNSFGSSFTVIGFGGILGTWQARWQDCRNSVGSALSISAPRKRTDHVSHSIPMLIGTTCEGNFQTDYGNYWRPRRFWKSGKSCGNLPAKILTTYDSRRILNMYLSGSVPESQP